MFIVFRWLIERELKIIRKPRKLVYYDPFNNKKLALEVKDLHHEYLPGREILKGIDMSISKGEIVGLIGHNGAGKTTMFQIISQQIRRK